MRMEDDFPFSRTTDCMDICWHVVSSLSCSENDAGSLFRSFMARNSMPIKNASRCGFLFQIHMARQNMSYLGFCGWMRIWKFMTLPRKRMQKNHISISFWGAQRLNRKKPGKWILKCLRLDSLSAGSLVQHAMRVWYDYDFLFALITLSKF